MKLGVQKGSFEENCVRLCASYVHTAHQGFFIHKHNLVLLLSCTSSEGSGRNMNSAHLWQGFIWGALASLVIGLPPLESR